MKKLSDVQYVHVVNLLRQLNIVLIDIAGKDNVKDLSSKEADIVISKLVKIYKLRCGEFKENSITQLEMF